MDDAEHAIGPGDFLGFPPGVAHLVRNPSSAPLVLLVGGEVLPDVDVADFPRLGRRLVRVGARVSVYALDAELPFLPPGVGTRSAATFPMAAALEGSGAKG